MAPTWTTPLRLLPPLFLTFSILFPRGCFGRSLGSFWHPFGSILVAFGTFWHPFGYIFSHFDVYSCITAAKNHIFQAPYPAKHPQNTICTLDTEKPSQYLLLPGPGADTAAGNSIRSGPACVPRRVRLCRSSPSFFFFLVRMRSILLIWSSPAPAAALAPGPTPAGTVFHFHIFFRIVFFPTLFHFSPDFGFLLGSILDAFPCFFASPVRTCNLSRFSIDFGMDSDLILMVF